MVEFKEMPYGEKFASILDYTKMIEGFAPKLVKQELGEERLGELLRLWKQEPHSPRGNAGQHTIPGYE